jgi:glucose-1-phosphate thymidylyltransferase
VVHAADDSQAPAWARTHLPDPVLCPQSRPDGVANAFALALPHLDAPALFLLGDVILRGSFPTVFPDPPAVATWEAASADTIRANFGVRLRGDQVVALVEKPPAVDDLICGLGAYLLGPDAPASGRSPTRCFTSGGPDRYCVPCPSPAST